ncbi:hypothetical protein BDN67DRAFT_983787 [Paxillus ammoniavirescens]|nr:hypothetical protein BDN67DRAFT_983787 [Paxillus ammoniavirescens]
MEFSQNQLLTILYAESVLQDTGLPTNNLKLIYEVVQGLNRVNHKASAQSWIVRPEGAIVKYPETGMHNNEAVAHYFLIDSTLSGGHTAVQCYLLHDATGAHMTCNNLKTSCKGIKICSTCDPDLLSGCQYHSCEDHSHLILHNFQEFDTGYLKALLIDDKSTITMYEEGQAKVHGYGPLVPCTFVASPSEHKQHCPCPQIAFVCHNPHFHPPPMPVKTPLPLVAVLQQLLLNLRWHLADTTPCRVVLDSGFMQGLWDILGWTSDCTPSLPDLHPSLTNLNHVWRIINMLRLRKYPHRIGFEADKSSKSKHGIMNTCNLMHTKDKPLCFFCICETHFQRNAFAIKHQLNSDQFSAREVYEAMLSLSSSDPHPNIDKTFKIIRSRGLDLE